MIPALVLTAGLATRLRPLSRVRAKAALPVAGQPLVSRIVKRAEETKAAGKPVRKDDDPAVFPERLREYYKKTAPLIGYYYAKGLLKGVDGMASVDEVTEQIEAAIKKAAKKSKDRQLTE